MTDSISLQFDPLSRTNNRKLLSDIAALVERILATELRLGLRDRTRRSSDNVSFLLAAEALICNLVLTAKAPGAVLAVPRSHKVMWGKHRYRNPVYGSHFVHLQDVMARMKMISVVTKGYRFSKVSKQATTVRPTRAFLKHFNIQYFRSEHLTQREEPEVILLKQSKDLEGVTKLIDYEDTPEVERLRQEVRTINAYISAADATLLSSDQGPAVNRDRQVVSAHHRALRRVFNNESWNAGGRLFGGFWMNMEREHRFARIRLDGERIANVDFSSLFPRLAYTRTNVPPPSKDLYEVEGECTNRDGWKKLTNALLFAVKPLRQWPKDTSRYFGKMKLQKAIETIKQKHHPIAHLFETGIGFQFMREESDMLVCILDALRQKDIVALPLHDSVLVAMSRALIAKRIMEREFKSRTGAATLVKIDTGTS